MNKDELGKAVAEELGMTYQQGGRVVSVVLDAIQGAVASGEQVRLAGHGTYRPAPRAARTARNPVNGKPVEVAAKVVPAFAPSQAFRDRVTAGHELSG